MAEDNVHPFIASQNQRMWHQVGLKPLERRSDIAQAQEVWDMHLVGVRSDGNQFTVTVVLLPQAMVQISGPQVAMGMHQQLMLAFGKLETYRNCDCDARFSLICRQHQEPAEEPSEPSVIVN